MRIVTFDIETANWMSDVGTSNPTDLTIALVCIHDSETGEYKSFLEPELPQLWKILENIDLLVGYNSDHFDIPLLNKYYPGDLTRIRSLDIMKEVQRVVGRRLRLDAIADGTLGKKKSGDGAQSIKSWRAGTTSLPLTSSQAISGKKSWKILLWFLLTSGEQKGQGIWPTGFRQNWQS